MVGHLSSVKKQWDAIVPEQKNDETSLNLKSWDDMKMDIEAYFLRMKELKARCGKILVGHEFDIENFWDQELKIATNMLCQSAVIRSFIFDTVAVHISFSRIDR